MNETIAYTPVKNADRELTVSTIKISPIRYDTVVFDDAPGKPNSGRIVGTWVIDRSAKWTTSRDEAMEAHRDALHAARTEPITDPPTDPTECPGCDGTGDCNECAGNGCTDCNETGDCPECDGTGEADDDA